MLNNEQQKPGMRFVPKALAGLVIVSLSDGGRNYGLYRVKQVATRSLVLANGPFHFPIGTHLDVEGYKYLAPNLASFNQRAVVVENNREGFHLTW